MVGRDPVELRGRLVRLRRPGASAVEGHRRTAVVAVDHDLIVLGVDPEVVGVAVGHHHHLEGLSAVDRSVEHHVQDVDGVGIHRIGEHVGVVPGALEEVPVFVDLAERLSRVVGAIEAALGSLGLDEREDSIGVRGRDRDPDLARGTLGKSLVQLGPGVAAVGRLGRGRPPPGRR